MPEKKLLHNMSKAIREFSLIPEGEKVLTCLSGGKDSFTMLKLLQQMRVSSNYKFDIHSLTLDQGQPGWQDKELKKWLIESKISHTILTKDTYSIVKEKIPENKTYCALCSRLRRGIIYSFAKTHGFKIIALGHHKQDAAESLLMSIMFNGKIQSMPPKLLTDDKQHILIRPMILCDELDIVEYANQQKFPIIPCNLCGNQPNLMRKQVKQMLTSMSKDHPNVISNISHALQSVQASQLHDKKIWDFDKLTTSA